MEAIFNNIWQALTHTPWWVYLILLMVVHASVRALKPHKIPLRKLFFLPVIFAFFSVHTLVTHFSITLFSVGTFSVAHAIGIFIGCLQVSRISFRYDKKNKLFEMPGTWTTLINISIIFATKYYFGFEIAEDPKLLENTHFELALLGVNGITTGMFLGRLACFLYRMRYNEEEG